MACESELERRSSLPLVVGFVVLVLVVIAGFAVWTGRRAYDEARDMEKMVLIAHTWMVTDPKISAELGGPASWITSSSSCEESKSFRTGHVTYKVTGPKTGGDVEVWLRQFPGSSWTVTGGILTTTDKRTIRIGTPPDPVPVAGKSN